MSPRKRRNPKRFRVGRVSVYPHHGAWWVYYRDQRTPVRRKVAANRSEAEQVAAQVNAQLATGSPSLLAFCPIAVTDLRQQFLAYHEYVLKSALATIRRYDAATRHLENFARGLPGQPQAHEVRADAFAAYLRAIEIAPNGHPHTARRRLRDKGARFILETCRALYAFAGKRRHLPPYAANPFAELSIDRIKVEDAKPVFVFDAATEAAFFQAADPWAFPLHFTLAKTGLRVGELVHLLIEEVDLDGGWLHVRNKVALGWRIKTGTERDIPLLAEVVAVLRCVIGQRQAGPVFLRARFAGPVIPPLVGNRRDLERVCEQRQRAAGPTLSRAGLLGIARQVWREAGAVKAEVMRTSFIRVMRAVGHAEATCPKSWRHTFATLLQDANVDPLIRQLTLGHRPTPGAGLGMTAHYTHTRPGTQRQQIERALRLWPQSLRMAEAWIQGGIR